MSLIPKSVNFSEDGSVVFDYMELPGDFRDNGMARQRQVMDPGHLIATSDAIEELREAAQKALNVIVREFANSVALSHDDMLEAMEGVPFHDGFEQDEEPGYDNPNEREATRDDG